MRRPHSAVLAAVDERPSWMVTTITRSSSSRKTYTISIQRHGPSRKRKPVHLPASAGPMCGKRSRERRERLTRRLVSAGRLCVLMSRSRSATATAASSTRATAYCVADRRSRRTVTATRSGAVTTYRSSSAIVRPVRACLRPCCALRKAAGIPSSSATTFLGSASVSSRACESSDRARVPSWTCVRSANRASFAARSASTVTLRRRAPRSAMSRSYTLQHGTCSWPQRGFASPRPCCHVASRPRRSHAR